MSISDSLLDQLHRTARIEIRTGDIAVGVAFAGFLGDLVRRRCVVSSADVVYMRIRR